MSKYIVLFFTHSGAIKFRRMCKKYNIDCQLMPVPRVLSSNCTVCAQILIDQPIESIIDDEIEKIFEINSAKQTNHGLYTMIYDAF